MKVKSRNACLSAAVVAVLYGIPVAHARDLTWDSSGTGATATTPGPVDGSGTWDTSNTNWYDPTGPSNVTWSNSNPDSAIFGTGTAGTANSKKSFTITLGTSIVAQNITLGTSSDGSFYNIQDDFVGDQTLTLNGNFTKTANLGGSTIFLANNLNLGAGNHVFAMNDTPGDLAEVTLNTGLGGSGSLTIDNGASFAQWGTLAINANSNYTGGTNINKGRLVITTSGGLGTGAVTIANQGVLSFGGGGLTPNNPMNVTTPITITRNTYTGTDFNDYPDALVGANGSGTNTIGSPLVIDSTDARVAANTSTIVIPNPLTAGPTVGAGNAVFTADGDFAGFITLSGDNTAFGAAGNTIKIIGGVEVNASSEANLGGATSKLNLSGGDIHPTGTLATGAFMTNFGAHDLSAAPINTGVDVDAGKTFTVNNLSGGAIGERGTGTLNFNGTNTFTGVPFFDAGTINVNGSTTLGAFRLRSSVLNVNNGATLTTTNSFTDIGSDHPDSGTVNVNSGGTLALGNNDFNVSDNAGTTGVLNVSGTGAVTVAGGTTYFGKSVSATGTMNMSGGTFNSSGLVFAGQNNGTGAINQTGGDITLTRNGNFTLVLGDGRGANVNNASGSYSISGGTLTSAGEIYVGEGQNTTNGVTHYGVGTWTQAGGTVTDNNWFVIGRENAAGSVDISGGTLIHNGGNMSLGDAANAGNVVDTINVHGTGVINDTGGELWLGNNGANAVMTVADSAQVTVNTWFAIGRGGSSVGTLNITGGTVTQQNSNFLDIGGDGGTATGTVNVSGGTLNAFQTLIGENGATQGFLNINGGNVNLSTSTVLANADTATGTINLNGGTLTAAGFTANNGGGTGKATFKFNGGTLVASADVANFIGAKVTSVVSTGGANISPGGHTITINSALNHDAGLSGADGGLAVSGTGTLTLTAANTYTGGTTVNGGTLVAANGDAFADGPLGIANGGTAQIQHGIAKAATITTLNIGGTSGKLDVNDRLVVKNSTLSYVEGQLAAGRNVAPGGIGDGTWNGSHGIVSSLAASHFVTDGIESRVVGVGVSGQMPFGDPVDPTTGQPVFAGATAGNILLRYTGNADATLDGVVDDQDVTVVGAFYDAGKTTGHHWYEGDFNGDGKIDDSDVTILGAFYQPGVTTSFLQSLSSDYGSEFTKAFELGLSLQTQVPEPSTISLVALAAAGLLGRRRRRA